MGIEEYAAARKRWLRYAVFGWIALGGGLAYGLIRLVLAMSAEDPAAMRGLTASVGWVLLPIGIGLFDLVFAATIKPRVPPTAFFPNDNYDEFDRQIIRSTADIDRPPDDGWRSTADPETAKSAIQARLAIAEAGGGRLLLTLEEYFDGHQDPGSIMMNLDAPPATTSQWLRSIRSRRQVSDVRVVVDPKRFAHEVEHWPVTEEIYVVTTQDPATVNAWLPEDIWADEATIVREAVPLDVPPGQHIVSLWWD